MYMPIANVLLNTKFRKLLYIYGFITNLKKKLT